MKNKIFLPLTISIATILTAIVVAADVLCLGRFDPLLRMYLGAAPDSTTQINGVDTNYYKPKYQDVPTLVKAEEKLVRNIASEGITLIKNDDNVLPLKKGDTVSLFSVSSVDFQYGGSGSGSSSVWLSTTLKEGLEKNGLKVNKDLYDFYASGEGAKFRHGAGVINFGVREDWSVKDCPANIISSNSKLVNSFNGTTAIFTFSRTGGEAGDPTRDMESFGGEKGRHYLEPSQEELDILSYLNEHFGKVIVLLNCNNAFELGWMKDYPNVKAVLHVPGLGRTGTLGLGEVLVGENLEGESISPSGKLVDTYSFDNFSAPSIQNFGDFSYEGDNFFYNAYNEGIYVGYRYYETRYFDKVTNRANVGDFDYDQTVAYPFGHGLSYADLEFGDITYTLEGKKLIGKVRVTNNSATHSGKEVVQAYISKPYTNYDEEHGIEKAAVELVGFAKTGNIAPHQSEEVEIAIDLERMKTYDEKGAKTYILEDGDYHFVLAHDSHEATKAVLAKEGYGTSELNTYLYHQDTFDAITYSKDQLTGKAINNLFAHGKYEGQQFLSRSNWVAMENEGLRYGYISQTPSAPNREKFRIMSPLSNDEKARLESTWSLNPTPNEPSRKRIADDKEKYIVNLRGLSVENEEFDKTVSKMSSAEIGSILTKAGYQIPGADSVSMPQSIVVDGPAGLNILPDHDSKPLGDGYFCMSWPTELAIASSWNVDYTREMGLLIADEGIYSHTAGWYGPACNIHRSPFSGRNFEYYSEDPYLSGILVRESAAAAGENGIIPFVKHFALNDQETHRDKNGLIAYANEQTIREIYLLPFELAVKAEKTDVISYQKNGDTYQKTVTKLNPVRGIMSSYNRIGSTWTGGNYNLITGVLRNEWGFEGMVLTDWNVNGHMNAYQMLEAGGDAKLDTIGVSSGEAHAIQTSVHSDRAIANILYAVANSNAMNGFAPDQKIIHGWVNYHSLLLGIGIGYTLIMIGIGVSYYFHFRKKKE